jgi:hypothetical protein
MSQIIRLSCSWCNTMNDVTEGRAVYCADCGHRADVLRIACDCRKCKDTERLLAIREREQERKRTED